MTDPNSNTDGMAGYSGITRLNVAGSGLPRQTVLKSPTPPGRLTSLRSRDLTLGGFKKKTFVPNVHSLRKSKDELKEEAHVPPKKDRRVREERHRERRVERRERPHQTIQSHSIFEQGPADTVKKPGGWRGTDLGDSRSSPVAKCFKKERRASEENDDDMLHKLQRDDFLDDPGLKNDAKNKPIQLPLYQSSNFLITEATTPPFRAPATTNPHLPLQYGPGQGVLSPDQIPQYGPGQGVLSPDQVHQYGPGQGVLSPDQIPQYEPGQGVLSPDQIPQYGPGQGVLSPDQILQYGPGQGVLSPDQIPQYGPGQGVLSPDQIPQYGPGQGVLSPDQIPQYGPGQGVLSPDQLTQYGPGQGVLSPDQIPQYGPGQGVLSPDQPSVADLFHQLTVSETEELLFIQLPDIIPGQPTTATGQPTTATGQPITAPEKNGKKDSKSDSKRCSHIKAPQLVSVRLSEGLTGDMSILGNIKHKLVCSPDFQALLPSPDHSAPL
ncbi:DNA-directed RNA polymerase III subunit RPC4 isoform X2 [Salvelinus fontinalis]|uniref:DNA-directed RNA polymerase III subunit RPC4 isoform X2 n=1 Tax=Salvelinus fontinalis TaxID=8038 RepID=UPI0024859985|nr:DNA-directed RNA polymerase III subunit RPC4 isoform X2 [Salvelinus fontinalis]